MNTYDAAYDLARAIKESDEMKRLTAAAEKSRAMMKQKMVKEYIMAQMKQTMQSWQARRKMKMDTSTSRNWQFLSAITAMPRSISRHLSAGIR